MLSYLQLLNVADWSEFWDVSNFGQSLQKSKMVPSPNFPIWKKIKNGNNSISSPIILLLTFAFTIQCHFILSSFFIFTFRFPLKCFSLMLTFSRKVNWMMINTWGYYELRLKWIHPFQSCKVTSEIYIPNQGLFNLLNKFFRPYLGERQYIFVLSITNILHKYFVHM